MIQSDIFINCRGVLCPSNYVKTKLALEEMDMGQILEVVVDEGEPSRHVPKSVIQDGQTVLDTLRDEEGFMHIFIQKTAE